MRLTWLSVMFVALALSGCSDALLEVDAGARRSNAKLGGATMLAGELDDLDRPVGAQGTPTFGVDISIWSGEITDAEVACWYDQGVRHVIAGTQNYRITRQQLDKSLEGGMSVDAYLYVHWETDVTRRLQEDFEMLEDYPIGRMWVDVEAAPAGRSVAQLTAKIREALDACQQAGVECGIYTAAWWWVPHMRNSEEFADVPLWYAYYDEDPSMSTWQGQEFGGWYAPWGKQWTEVYFCGIDVDKNTIYTSSEPVAPPKDLSPGGSLTAPTGLYPDDLVRVKRETVRVLVDTVPGAQNYEFEVEHYSGGWLPYWTFTSSEPAYRFSALVKDRVMRFRARASGAGEQTDWSDWAYFEKGTPREVPDILPSTDETVEPVPEPEPEVEPEPTPEDVTGAPAELSPPDGSGFGNGAAVDLTCDPVGDASRYEFEIENYNGGLDDWVSYYTHTSASSSRRFYPVSNLAYRWRVRAVTPTGTTPASAWHHFVVGSASAR